MKTLPRFIQKILPLAPVIAVLAAVFIGCDDGSTDTRSGSGSGSASTSGSTGDAAALPPGLMVAAAPADAKGVAAVRGAAKDGDEVVVMGKVGGDKEPFVQGRAAFRLVDTSLKSCSDIPGDECPTPWDYCCVESKDVADNSISVQVVDSDGRLLKTGLKGVGRLQPLSEVTVKGKVQKKEGTGAVVVNATGIHVKQ